MDFLGAKHAETWNYRLVIGKLNYLANNTRPDISMAVHQCTCYCSNPKAIHESAVKQIARYLLSTQDKGLVLYPFPSLSLDMHVDAEFAGRWNHEYSELHESILSRVGYVISFCGCPVVWASKLQSPFPPPNVSTLLFQLPLVIFSLFSKSYKTFIHCTIQTTIILPLVYRLPRSLKTITHLSL